MTQDEIRAKFEYLHTEMGIPYSFIAKGCKFTSQGFIAFIKGKRGTSPFSRQLMMDFYNQIKEKGRNI